LNEASSGEAGVLNGTGRRTYGEFYLTVLALIASVVPIFTILIGPLVVMMRNQPGTSLMQLVNKTTTMQPSQQQMMATMKEIHVFTVGYVWFALIPALLVLLGIAAYAYRRYPRLYNRIAWGLGAGAIATLGLELIRLPGVLAGAFPGDMPGVFGQMIVGQKGALALIAGYTYHFLNGATFGIMYTLLFGKARWYWGIAWGLFFEFGMMISPPVLMMAGPFGVRGFWPELFVVTFAAHVIFGAVFGWLAERNVAHRGGIFSTLNPPTKTAKARS
jgi:uncharacterized Tic20 family protein